jgi:hypothetical protein
VQAADAQGAGRLVAFRQRAVGAIRDQIATDSAPDSDLQMPTVFDQVQRYLTPRIEGDRLVCRIDETGLTEFAQLLVPVVQRARKQAEIVGSLSNLKQIAVGLISYAGDHKGIFPDNFQQLIDGGYSGSQTFRDPRRPDLDVGYVYCKPAATYDKVSKPSTHILAYEKFDTWPDGGISVCFADGHSEQIADQQSFERLLEKSKADDAADAVGTR